MGLIHPPMKATDWSQYDLLSARAFLGSDIPASGNTILYSLTGKGFLTHLSIFLKAAGIVPSLIIDGVEQKLFYGTSQTSVYIAGTNGVGGTATSNILQITSPIYFESSLQVKLYNVNTTSALGNGTTMLGLFQV